jgi:hypothetical protein
MSKTAHVIFITFFALIVLFAFIYLSYAGFPIIIRPLKTGFFTLIMLPLNLVDTWATDWV